MQRARASSLFPGTSICEIFRTNNIIQTRIQSYNRLPGENEAAFRQGVEEGWDQPERQLSASYPPRARRAIVPWLDLHWPDPESLIDDDHRQGVSDIHITSDQRILQQGESQSCGEVTRRGGGPISVIESRTPQPARSVPSAVQNTTSTLLMAGSAVRAGAQATARSHARRREPAGLELTPCWPLIPPWLAGW